MKKIKAITFLVVALFAGSVLLNSFFSRADAIPSIFEIIASPPADPDPRDETSIAISPRNDQIIVGASKVIRGGGTAGRGDTLVDYYYSADGGRSWGTGQIGLETAEKTWGRATD